MYTFEEKIRTAGRTLLPSNTFLKYFRAYSYIVFVYKLALPSESRLSFVFAGAWKIIVQNENKWGTLFENEKKIFF